MVTVPSENPTGAMATATQKQHSPRGRLTVRGGSPDPAQLCLLNPQAGRRPEIKPLNRAPPPPSLLSPSRGARGGCPPVHPPVLPPARLSVRPPACPPACLSDSAARLCGPRCRAHAQRRRSGVRQRVHAPEHGLSLSPVLTLMSSSGWGPLRQMSPPWRDLPAPLPQLPARPEFSQIKSFISGAGDGHAQATPRPRPGHGAPLRLGPRGPSPPATALPGGFLRFTVCRHGT